MKERNYTIDFFRIIFILIICIHHFQPIINAKFINTGFLCVEFFFIVSGFFLYKSFKKNSNSNGLKYTIGRIKKLYPLYIFAFIVILILTTIESCSRGNLNVQKSIFTSISEILLLQNIGIFNGGINYPMWYLSTLIVSGFFIFELLKRDKNLYLKLLGPLSIIIYFAFINKNYGTLEVWDNINGIYLPLVRTFVDMTIGCILSYIMEEYSEKIKNSLTSHKFFYGIIEIINYIILFYLIIKNTPYQIYSVIAFTILIAFANIENSICYKLFNNKIFRYNGDLSYSMYVNHASIILIFEHIYKRINYLQNNTLLCIAMYIIILIIYSYCIDKIVKRITQRKEV